MVREMAAALEEHAAAEPPPAHEPANPPADDRVGQAGVVALAHENAALREKLDALALELARREGEAQAAAWSVAELERRLAAQPPAPPSPGPAAADAQAAATADLQHRLGAALDELDALRQALTQEPAARFRAESGEELTRARAEIQRQAALLEQLGQKLQTGMQGQEAR
jgi:hypothetical protein